LKVCFHRELSFFAAVVNDGFVPFAVIFDWAARP
jgi:hypothetical protein